MSDPAGEQGRGPRRRAELVEAAGSLILEQGPAQVTHRRVAARAGASLSATTYYFRDLEELRGEGARLIAELWAEQAEWAAERAEEARPDREETLDLLCDALLPPPAGVRGHYEQLAGAGRSTAVAAAYRDGRQTIRTAVGRVLTAAGSACVAEVALAVVDGAVLAALSDGRDPRAEARRLLGLVL
ncbi:transcriptional regulator, TetR family [Georgenia satyanarayanai]|uniref:Transcriptional regulator, TetR family n=1 Tax=Georgenia satyanarayanai TaxID=860221 RepID=A0A2Y9C648_9MICO|nr:TetR family transcriptional regulator [Georgenia satyanarayanai]PYF99578.1 TetR family transcriptional regulator [Georgenia satyanarayanai]SSA42423.1 transcriptional regulator, TetR family [Georgenia satyanarayanai]